MILSFVNSFCKYSCTFLLHAPCGNQLRLTGLAWVNKVLLLLLLLLLCGVSLGSYLSWSVFLSLGAEICKRTVLGFNVTRNLGLLARLDHVSIVPRRQ